MFCLRATPQRIPKVASLLPFRSMNIHFTSIPESTVFAKLIGESKQFRKYNSTFHTFTIPACTHLPKLSDKHTACLVRNLATTLGHQVGTCKMGPANDPDAVVDAELKVYGIRGLRVIDGSIMPNIIAGHPNSVIMMIAEKGSDIIKDAWK